MKLITLSLALFCVCAGFLSATYAKICPEAISTDCPFGKGNKGKK